jgi:hypothetical protein
VLLPPNGVSSSISSVYETKKYTRRAIASLALQPLHAISPLSSASLSILHSIGFSQLLPNYITQMLRSWSTRHIWN